MARRSRKSSEKRDWLAHVERALSAGSTLALVLAQLRKEKGVVGWIAIGLSATQFALVVRKQYKELSAPDLWGYFSDDEKWSIAPPLLGNLITKNCDSQEMVAKDSDFEIQIGKIGDEKVAWRVHNTRLDYGPFFVRGREEETLRAIGDKLWAQISGPHAVLGDKGAIETADEAIDHEVVEFDALLALHARVKEFYDDGGNRSYLLEGPPGTGKSTAVRYMLSKLGVRSLRLNFETASSGSGWYDGESISRNVEALIQALRPEVLIIDDFDRNWMLERDLLRLMEVAHRCCRVVLATINNKADLSRAMQRVGRFDDHIVIDHIELSVLKAMLDPELQKYARRMMKWPIAFVGDFNRRKRVLGVMAAADEFESLHARATGKRPPSRKKAGKKKTTKRRTSTPKAKPKAKPKKASTPKKASAPKLKAKPTSKKRTTKKAAG